MTDLNYGMSFSLNVFYLTLPLAKCCVVLYEKLNTVSPSLFYSPPFLPLTLCQSGWLRQLVFSCFFFKKRSYFLSAWSLRFLLIIGKNIIMLSLNCKYGQYMGLKPSPHNIQIPFPQCVIMSCRYWGPWRFKYSFY